MVHSAVCSIPKTVEWFKELTGLASPLPLPIDILPHQQQAEMGTPMSWGLTRSSFDSRNVKSENRKSKKNFTRRTSAKSDKSNRNKHRMIFKMVLLYTAALQAYQIAACTTTRVTHLLQCSSLLPNLSFWQADAISESKLINVAGRSLHDQHSIQRIIAGMIPITAQHLVQQLASIEFHALYSKYLDSFLCTKRCFVLKRKRLCCQTSYSLYLFDLGVIL